MDIASLDPDSLFNHHIHVTLDMVTTSNYHTVHLEYTLLINLLPTVYRSTKEEDPLGARCGGISSPGGTGVVTWPLHRTGKQRKQYCHFF